MSRPTPHKRRGVQALISLVVALGLLLSGAAAVWRDARSGQAPEVSGPVLPGWSEQASSASRIRS